VQTESKIESQFRPPIKCKDPEFGNPISCDDDDITRINGGPAPKDALGFTPIKVIEGGPRVKGPLDD